MRRAQPDFVHLQMLLKKRRGFTLQLLHRTANPAADNALMLRQLQACLPASYVKQPYCPQPSLHQISPIPHCRDTSIPPIPTQATPQAPALNNVSRYDGHLNKNGSADRRETDRHGE